jgi:uncharacterized membrane protein YphA (DoxX/SURF4 family)
MKCCQATDVLAAASRWFLGAVFILMGMTKGLAPVEFLKVIRQYNAFESHTLMNFVAATLPWFEVFCGLLLILGVAVRGTTLLLIGMLVPFTILIWQRALDIQQAKGLAFCAIKFDCGCGSGEVPVCRKLAENAGLIVLSVWLLFWPTHRWCLWGRSPRKQPPAEVPALAAQ